MRKPFALLLALALLAPPASAFDVGDPWFRRPDDPRITRVEVAVDWNRRDVRMEYDHLLLGNPVSGPTSYFTPKPGDLSGTTRYDYLKTRLTYAPVGVATFHFDIGFDGETSNGDDVLLLGGSTHLLLLEGGPFALSAQLGVTFVPQVTTLANGVSDTRGPYTQHGDFDAHEYGAALLASMTAECSEDFMLMTYGGPRISAYRGEFRSYADFPDTGERIWLDGVEKQQSLFGLVLGARLDWGERWAGRVEGRLIEEASLTTSLIGSY